MWRGVAAAGLGALLLVGALAPGVAAAQSELGGKPSIRPTVDLFRPRFLNAPMSSSGQEAVQRLYDRVIPLLSGSVWLITAGKDPLSGALAGVERTLHPAGPRLVPSGAPAAQGGGGVLFPYRDPSAKFSRNILIPRDFSQSPLQTEPHLAVDPKDPNHIIAGMIDYNFPGVTAYVSIDGGVTWDGPFQMRYPREQVAAAGDPVLAFGQDGTAYFAFISLDTEEFSIGRVVGEAVVSSIALAASTDGGYTWSSAVPSARSTVRTSSAGEEDGFARGEIAFEFLDKPWLAAGPHPKDPKKTVLYVTYTKFISRYNLGYAGELPFLTSPVLETVIELVRSEDGGISWSKPIEVSPRVRQTFGSTGGPAEPGPLVEESASEGATASASEGGPVDGLRLAPPSQTASSGSKRVVQGSQPAVAPDGTVYVAWLDSTDDGPFEGVAQIYVARSDNAGVAFTKGRAITTFTEPGFSPRTSFFRYWGSAFAQIAVGPQGDVYVAYVGLPSGDPKDDGNVYVVRSLAKDKGEKWDQRVQANDDQTSRLQFFPAIAVGPDGKVHVMFGDMRDDPRETQYHIYYAMAEAPETDAQGKTKPLAFGLNARVTDAYSNPNYGFPGGQFIGDYFAIKATQDEVYMLWADTRLGEFQGTNQKIGFARRRQMPNPAVVLSPPRGAGGRDVTIQGFNYQPNQNLFIQVGGVTVATERTGPQGTFTTRLFIPISGEGAHDVAVVDASGNAALSSFFMDFGFDNIKKTSDQVTALSGRLQSIDTRLATPPQTPQEVTAEFARMKTSLDRLEGLPGLIAAQAETSAAAAAEERRRDRRTLAVAIVAAGAAALALIGAGVAAARGGGRRRWEERP